MRHILLFALLALALIACGRKGDNSAIQPDSSAIQHRYPLSGKIVGLNAKSQTATIDAAAIPNFMEAMIMEYPIKSKSEFETLRVGDHITATIDVHEDNTYEVEGIHKDQASK